MFCDHCVSNWSTAFCLKKSGQNAGRVRRLIYCDHLKLQIDVVYVGWLHNTCKQQDSTKGVLKDILQEK